MKKILIVITCLLQLASFGHAAEWLCPAEANLENFRIEGRVVDARSGEAVYGVAVSIEDSGIWATTDEKGQFSFDELNRGTYVLSFQCLGYKEKSVEVMLGGNTKPRGDVEIVTKGEVCTLTVRLELNSLALDGVTVTAERAKDGLSTNLRLGADALNHLQMSNVTDIAALLPGGKTVNPDLTSENTISLRGGGLTSGNAAFATAVEVDGVRLGNNASFGSMSGVDTRNIAVENIESIEVITGVPSAEYGDLNSGMVRINTKKGSTPGTVTFAANPKTYQVSLAKGIDLQENRGVLNVSAEWTRATAKLSSPYSSYTRRGFSFGYSNTFKKVLRLEAGFTGNIGGMNTEDDPDAYVGTWTKVRDNVFRGNVSLTWLLRKPWITNLKMDASINYNDNLSHEHGYESSASNQPAVHSELQGYYVADRLPTTYFYDLIEDSKELDYAASLKYEWNRKFGGANSKLKAGVQWKATGNVGKGEYYEDMSVAADGYRARPYTDYPYMHNVAAYLEEDFTFPIGKTSLEISAGVRMENVFVEDTEYDKVQSFSPRFNARWKINDCLAIRAGWGITEKLPSYYILYPVQEYRDIQVFGFSHGDSSTYVYYTQPYSMLYNENLKWQRNINAELGIEASFWGTSVSLVGWFNQTRYPYTYYNTYTPFSYDIMELPDGYTVPDDPQIMVDSQTGTVYLRGSDSDYWTAMNVKVTDKTFYESDLPSNGNDIFRAGAELIIDFPEIKPISTQLRLDGNYSFTRYIDNTLTYFYRTGWSHSIESDKSYEYVGIYANGGNGSSTVNGKVSHKIDANITAITRIPQARLVVTCRLEMSLLNSFWNLSQYKGKEYAFNVSESGTDATGGSIYDGDSYTAIYPVMYMDEDGVLHEFTETEASDPAFANLILKSGNAYTFAKDGYGVYMSANLSITKEMGDHVSLSFYANNFTNSRKWVTSKATGVSAIFTPSFYYGLTCRLKF